MDTGVTVAEETRDFGGQTNRASDQRIDPGRGGEIAIPNAFVLGNATRNYSRVAGSGQRPGPVRRRRSVPSAAWRV